MPRIKIAVFIIVVLTISMVISLVKFHSNAVARSLQTGDFDLAHFNILLFPVNNDQAAVSARAYLVSIDEYSRDVIGIYRDGQLVQVRKDSLTAWPLACDVKALVSGLNAEIVKWGSETDWQSVEYGYENVNDQIEISLKLDSKNGDYRIYKYICQKDGTVVPMSIKSKPGGHLL